MVDTEPAPVQPARKAAEPTQPVITNGADIIFDDMSEAPARGTHPSVTPGETVIPIPPATGKPAVTKGKTAAPNTPKGKTKAAKNNSKTPQPDTAMGNVGNKNDRKTEKKTTSKTHELDDEYFDFDGF